MARRHTIQRLQATAYTTNVARVQLAEDFAADPEKLKAFFAGKPIDDGCG